MSEGGGCVVGGNVLWEGSRLDIKYWSLYRY